MQAVLLILSSLAAAPHEAPQQATRPAQPAVKAPPAPAVLRLRTGMKVYASDGVLVAETAHIPSPIGFYEPNASFFTVQERPFMERRIYAREAWLDGDVVRLRMTAAQFRARGQNPPGAPGS